jgi:hypothetical protein
MTTLVEQAAVTIPAAYLEDVRCALVEEIESDSGALTVDQAHLVASGRSGTGRIDRDGAVGILSKDLQLLAQLLDATDDTQVTAEPATISETLQATVRVLGRRLSTACRYAPVPLGDVVELSARLRSAADEAIRLYSGLADRLSAEEAAAYEAVA